MSNTTIYPHSSYLTGCFYNLNEEIFLKNYDINVNSITDGAVMTTIKINDPWIENLYHKEFGANPAKFIETIKTFLK